MTTTETRPLFSATSMVISTAEEGSPEWHEVRRGGMGGSDVAAALGMSKYTSPLAVYLEKRGEMPTLPENEALSEYGEMGHALQDVIAGRWAHRSGYRWEKAPGTLTHLEAEWMRVNLDGICYDPDGEPGVLEIKNRSEYQLAEWEEGVPAGPALQAHWGMAITGYSYAVVAALIGGNKLRWHVIERDPELEDNLVTLVAEFWRGVLEGREPVPDASEATSEMLGHLYGVEPGKIGRADRSLVEPLREELEKAKAAEKAAKEAVRGVRNRLHKIAGSAEVVLADGEDDNDELFTLKANGQFASAKFRAGEPVLAREYTHMVPAIDTARLSHDHPETYARYRARVLRMPAAERNQK